MSKLSNNADLFKNTAKTAKTAKKSAFIRADDTGTWIRKTYIVREDQAARLADIAFTDRKTLKEVVEEAFTAYITQREANGKILKH